MRLTLVFFEARTKLIFSRRRYDLKTEIAKSPVSRMNPELLKHPAAQTKMSSAMKRRAADIED